MAKFVPPKIQDNPSGWGPCQLPSQFEDMPYQPFSKGDRLGKVRRSLLLLLLNNFSDLGVLDFDFFIKVFFVLSLFLFFCWLESIFIIIYKNNNNKHLTDWLELPAKKTQEPQQRDSSVTSK